MVDSPLNNHQPLNVIMLMSRVQQGHFVSSATEILWRMLWDANVKVRRSDGREKSRPYKQVRLH